MTDFTESYVADREKWLVDNSPGVKQADALRAQDQKVEDDKVKSSQSIAYDGANLGAIGPKEDEYDYEAAYKDGNSFKTDEGGGVTLKNKNFKVGQAYVAGKDLNTGEQLSGEWDDKDGDIERGRKALSEGEWNTQNGSTYKQTDGLFDVANGVLKNGGTFQDYQNSIQGPWNHDQIAMGWNAAETAHRTMSDIDTQGRRYYDEMRKDWDQYEGVLNTIPLEGYTEETLAVDKDWIAGGRLLGNFIFGAGTNDKKTDEQIGEATKTLVSQFRNNFDMTMWWADRVIQENDPELARAWLALDAQYDAMDTTMDSFGRAMSAQMNITNLVTFGGGMLVSALGKKAIQESVKQAMKRVIGISAAEAGISGVMGGAEDAVRQEVEITADVREEFDIGQMVLASSVNATLGFGMGMGLNSITNPTLLGYAGDKASKGLRFVNENFKDMDLVGPMPGGLEAQRGSVDFSPPVTKGDDQVRASFKLQELMAGIKDGTKPITIRENIKAALNKGLITPQEVKWSGVYDLLDSLEESGGKASRTDIVNYVERKTPRPKLIDSQSPEYHSYSLLSKNSEGDEKGLAQFGYKERMIVLPGRANPDSTFGTNHFRGAESTQLDADDAMIGHSRVESAELATAEFQEVSPEGVVRTPKGKMVLEQQSDFHKAGQKGGYVNDEGVWVGTQPIQKQGLEEGQGGHLVNPYAAGSQAMYEKIIKAAQDNNIDPMGKNSIMDVWPFLDKEIQEEIIRNKPRYQPYGKDWDALGMRLEIMDSINQGDEFIAWPSTEDQISIIEDWGAAYEGDGRKGIVKRATVDRNKAMKKMGLEVEEIDMPQYIDSMRGSNVYDMELSAFEVIDNPTIRANMNEVMSEAETKFTAVLHDGQKVELSNDDMVYVIDYSYGDPMIDIDEAVFTATTKDSTVTFKGIDEARDYMYDIYETSRIKYTEELNNAPTNDLDLETIGDEIHEVLRRQNMLLELDTREGGNPDDWLILSYPQGIPEGLSAPELRAQGEVLEVIKDADYWERIGEIVGKTKDSKNKKTKTKFNVIRLTDEVKARFRKEGMKMYGVGGLGAGAAVEEKIKSDRKRDKNGRFVK